MISLVYTDLAWVLVVIFVGRKFFSVWKAGLLGVGLALVVDYFGTRFSFYLYPGWGLYLGKLPILHLINIYALSILFFAWLPRTWSKRMLYIVLMSTAFLLLEAVMYSLGAIIYPRWKLWYSWFLVIAGLLLMSWVYDHVRSPKWRQPQR